MERSPSSHKGENGKVAVIGGSSTIHGAPLFSALAAEASGVDLLFVAVPKCHADAAKMTSLNFQVHPFTGDEMGEGDIQPLFELLATVDCAVIGPGLARSEKAQQLIRQLIAGAACPLVLDASALQPWTLLSVSGKTAVLTPHHGELERMGIPEHELSAAAYRAHVTMHLKGPTDSIVAPDGSIQHIDGGNAGLTVGGTGDALAGLIAGLIAQKREPPVACMLASTIIKHAGTLLHKEMGFGYTTRQVIGQIPKLLGAYDIRGMGPY